MMTPMSAGPYDDWKAPKADGQALLWPEPVTLVDDARRNKDRLDAADILINNVPLGELRRDARQFLGLGDGPVVATGHQSELYHPGVWAKNAVLHHAADALGGEAVHFVVDTDQPKHLNLRQPPSRPGEVGADEPITDDPALASAAWAGRLAAPSPAHVARLRAAVTAAELGHEPVIGGVLDALSSANVEQEMTFAPGNGGLVAALTAATHELDWSLGLRHAALPLSPMLVGDAFLAFASHVAGRADAFAADYNAALADYRRAEDIDDPMRPMPDLDVTADRVEIPYWLDDLATGRRGRAAVVRRAGGFALAAFDGDEYEFSTRDAADLRRWLLARQLRLAPRALALTLFLRLCVVDQFVHGIGGGRYDQVTDRLIARHFGLAPPRFAVATATLFWPGSGDVDRACPPCLKIRRHRLRHAALGDEKGEHLAAIRAARTPGARWRAFERMHAALRAAAGPALARVTADLDAAPLRVRWERAMFDRELFYALQPRARLAGLIDRFAFA